MEQESEHRRRSLTVRIPQSMLLPTFAFGDHASPSAERARFVPRSRIIGTSPKKRKNVRRLSVSLCLTTHRVLIVIALGKRKPKCFAKCLHVMPIVLVWLISNMAKQLYGWRQAM